MKKFISALFCLCIFLSPLAAQAALVATYQGKQSVGLGTYVSPLFNAVPIGTAYASRRVLFLFVWHYSFSQAGLAITGLTINGVSAGSNQIVLDGASTWIGSYIWAWADIPSGTTATVDATGCNSSCNGFGSTVVYAYTFDGTLADSAPTHAEVKQTSTATSITNTLNTTANGFLISAAHTWALSSITGLGVTASTESLTTDDADSANKRGVASKTSGTSVNTPSSVTWSWTTAQQSYATMLYWAPVPPPPIRKMRLFEGYKIKLVSGVVKVFQQ